MLLEELDNEVETKDASASSADGSEHEDTDSSDNDTKNDRSDDEVEGNAGWADSVAKILRTNKPKGKKTLVLSKAKKLPDIRRQKTVEQPPEFQIDGEIKEEKPDPLALLDQLKQEDDEPARKKRKELPKVRVKPNVLDRDRERTLAKIATRGVVQLFNAVRDQQKELQGKLEGAGPLERKKEQVLKSLDKRQFLDVLMGEKARSEAVDGEVKDESERQTGSTWGVLRDDFMVGARMKDWDKQQDDEDQDDD